MSERLDIGGTARATADAHALLPWGAPVLVMVSGGADSVALLRLLASGVLGDLDLRVLHVNHLLRGADSDGDERFVRDLAVGLGVACRAVGFDVRAWADAEGLNLEDAGRRVRYRFAEEELDRWCAELGVDPGRGVIAVAHTRDDRIETFFMRALFGAGTGALGSIAVRRGRIVRPLLGCDRDEIRSWLRERGLGWREDASNADTSRMRARVRAEMIVTAEGVNPSFRDALERTMDLLADDDALLGRMAEAFARDFVEGEPGVEAAFNRDWMGTLERTMARRTVRAALFATFEDAGRLEAEHIEAIVDGLASETFARDLPFGLRAFTEYGRLIVSRAGAESPSITPTLLPIPGTADLGIGGAISAEIADGMSVDGTKCEIVVDVGEAGQLTVGSTAEGERMRPFGMAGTRKLSDMLIDAKVPARQRMATPVVRDGTEVVWLAGVRMSEGARVTTETSRPVRLTWLPGSSAEPTGCDGSATSDGPAR